MRQVFTEHTRTFRLTMLASLLAGTFTAPVLAQSEESAEEPQFEAITVTATKRPQAIYEVPIAISAFDGDKLAEQGITTLVDVGKFVPNLNITGFSAGHTASANPFVRGIGLQDHLITTDPGVSVYVDGVYLGRQVGQNWNLNNIKRIEVLRGPQGTLYGRNSIGGAINIITKQPDDEDITKVSVEAGSRGRLKTDVFLNHALTDKLAFNLNLGYNTRDGLGKFTNLPDAEYDVGETEEVYGRLSVKYDASDRLRFVLTADGNNGDGGLRPYTTMIDEVPTGAYYTGMRYGSPTVAGPLRNADVGDIYDNATGTLAVSGVSNEARGISLTTEWDMNDDMTLKIIGSNRTSEYKAGLDDDSTIYALDHYPERGDADQTSVELQLNGYLTESLDFVTGLYWFEEEGSNRQGEDSMFNGGANLLELDQKTTSKAAFVNLGYDVTDSLRISGGLRYTEDEKEATANVGIGPFTSEDSWNQVSFDLSSNYVLENGMNVYASIQSGYQSGQFPARPFCLFSDPECFVASDNITATNYEIGLKGRVTSYFDMSIALFNTEYDDLPYQVSQVGDGGFVTTNLVVAQTSRGIEWDSTLTLGNFSVQTSIGYIDVDVEEQNGVKPVAPLTPELTAAIGPTYTFPLANGGSIRARIDYSFRDDMYGEPSDDPGRLTMIESRELVNADIAYTPADEGYTVALYGRNIFDERYDDARLNTGDYIIRVLSNDASEFGVRFSTSF